MYEPWKKKLNVSKKIDIELGIVLPGNVISKKNGQKIIRCGRFPKIMAGDAFINWETKHFSS